MSNEGGRIPPTDEAVLKALATYRFMTPKQLMRVGVTSEKSHLYQVLRRLTAQNPAHERTPKAAPTKRRRPALVREFDFGAIPGLGRLDKICMLTPRGAAVLAEHDPYYEALRVPRDATIFTSDYGHRVGCVDFHIALRAWAASAGTEVDFFDAYYDPGSGGAGRALRGKTRIALRRGAFAPDAIFALIDPRGVRKLYAFEFYGNRTTAYISDKLTAYLSAIDQEAIEKAYQYKDYAARILCVFDSSNGMRLVCERVRALPAFQAESASFWIAHKEAVDGDFVSAWHRFEGEKASPF